MGILKQHIEASINAVIPRPFFFFNVLKARLTVLEHVL